MNKIYKNIPLALDKRENIVYNITGIEVWLSLVEYYVRDVGAAGSNPVTSTNAIKTGSFAVQVF